jgi:hypothetical protein
MEFIKRVKMRLNHVYINFNFGIDKNKLFLNQDVIQELVEFSLYNTMSNKVELAY